MNAMRALPVALCSTLAMPLLLLASCAPPNPASDPRGTTAGVEGAAASADAGHTPGYNPLRNPYFGQTHQHTGWSFDEAIYNVRLGPDNSYRHARGEKVRHPAGYDVQLRIPLDFMVVSDPARPSPGSSSTCSGSPACFRLQVTGWWRDSD